MYLHELQEEKLAGLSGKLKQEMLQLGAEERDVDLAIKDVMRGSGFEITAPIMEVTMSYITITSFEKGDSIKPGNIILNAKNFFSEIPSLIILSSDLQEGGWILKAMAFIVLWQQLLKLSTRQLHKDEAILLNALWHNKKSNNTIDLEKGFQVVNSLRSGASMQEIDWETYIDQLQNLEKGRHLKQIDSFIYLCEEIQVKYK